MKNLLITIESLGTGGAEKALVNFIKHYHNKYNCYVLVYTEQDNYYEKEINNLATVRYVLPKYLRRMAKVVSYINPSLLYRLTVKRVFKNIDFDIELAYLEGVATKIIAGSSSKSKKIAWIHCDFSENHWCKHYYKDYQEEKYSYKIFDLLFFVTDRQKSSFIEYWGIKENLCAIPNLLDIDLIKKLSEEELINIHKPYICAIGSLKPVKGFELLIDSFYIFSQENNDCHLYILGKGYLESTLQAKINNYNLNDRVHLVGFESNPYKYIKNSIGLIQTSLSESFGYVLLEAAILHKNVAASKTVGSIEIKSKYSANLNIFELNLENITEALWYLSSNRKIKNTEVSFSNSEIINAIDTMIEK